MTILKQEFEKLNNERKKSLFEQFNKKFGVKKPRFYQLINYPEGLTGERLKFFANYFSVSIDTILNKIED